MTGSTEGITGKKWFENTKKLRIFFFFSSNTTPVTDNRELREIDSSRQDSRIAAGCEERNGQQ